MSEMTGVIVTRAEPGATETARFLAAHGVTVLKTPALDIRLHELEADWAPINGEKLIFTSANGVRCYKEAGWSRDGFAVCVGPATTAAASEAGFQNLQNTNGDADQLVAEIIGCWHPGEDRFVHYANDAAAGDVCRRLQEAGFAARFVPLYGARPVPWAQVQFVWQSVQANRDVLLIHSAKAAEAVKDWLGQAQLDTKNMKLVGISERAVRPLMGLEWHCVERAEQPNEMKLMEALQKVLSAGVML
ncbi:MAG: hypothetical protein CMK09_03655 [Ponticaulis sp.]|nr:hypothetical protein [Ponticaulis sp.]|tara:strand:- start:9458 stop:10195 length:738 start_codon:yes stop_codon:yes gene_type:complete